MTNAFSIEKAGEADLPFIYRLFGEAIAYQQANGYSGWKVYDRDFIRAEAGKGLLFKIVEEGSIACIFSVCYSDALIWGEREKGDAVYVHRVVVNRRAAGNRWFEKVLHWAKALARSRGSKYLRIDTWADNPKLIGYYQGYGFRFVENYTTADDAALPAQHRNLNVALLELSL